MFKSFFSEMEIKEKLSAFKELNNDAYEHLLGKIEFNRLQRFKKSTRQMIKRYLARGIKEYKKRMSVKELISYINSSSHKRKILYICYTPTFNLVRQSIYLRNTGKFETILLMENPWLGDFAERCFDTVYVYDSCYTIAYILKEVSPYIIHVQGAVVDHDYLGILAKFLGKSKVVFEFFDIASLSLSKEESIELWGKVKTELGFFSERFACERCDGLIMGYSPEAHEILKNRYHITAPMLEFHSYVCDEFISDDNGKYSDVDGNIHLVYGGSVAPSYSPERFWGDVQYHRLIEKLTKQGIYFDIYISPHISPLKIKQQFGDYILLSEKEALFNFKRGLPPDEVTSEFSKYDFGAMIYLFDRGTFSEEHNQNRLPGKVFTYLEAGLPIIISEEIQYVAKLVKEHEIGIVVSQKDLDNLPEIINSYDREKLNTNVKKAKEELSMKRHIGRLIKFYESIVQ